MTTNFTFDPKEHVYTLDGKPMTGMTTILGVLGKPALVPWAARMAVEHIEAELLYTINSGFSIAEITEERWDQIFKEAKVAHAKKKTDAASKGTDTHAQVEDYINDCIENYDGKPYIRTKPNTEARDKDPLTHFVKWAMREKVKFLASEMQVYSRSLWVAGTMDFLFEKDGKRYIGDLKTYKKLWDRVPMFQCAGYAYLYEEMEGDRLRELTNTDILSEEEMDSFTIAGYVVFNLPKERPHDPLEDVKWSFDTEGDTKAFLACVELYRQLANWK